MLIFFFLAVAAARGAPGGAIFAAGQLMGLAFRAKLSQLQNGAGETRFLLEASFSSFCTVG